jgi:hypothetical protein
MIYQIDIRNFKSFTQFKERFLSYFPENYQDESMTDSCWNWKGSTTFYPGYGIITYGKRYVAHKMSYITFKGPVRSDQVVRHTCDNKCCVNPKHLILGTQSDNLIDAVKRNRQGLQKLNEECVKVIKWLLKYKPEKGLASKLARLHNVHISTISDIKRSKTWSFVAV